jgi:riboflavin kinase/FMN adenylyltransferase
VHILEWPEFAAGAVRELAGGKRTALTVGVFDGIHRGHQALLDAIIGKAPEMFPLVITFRKNPKEFLKKDGWEGDILSLNQKLDIFRRKGLPALALIDFSEKISKMAGRDFLEILRGPGNLGFLAVGSNFHCGYRMDTGAEEICSFFRATGVAVEVLQSKTLGGEHGLRERPISSSRIRAAIRSGNVREAAELLGRPVEVDLSAPVSVSESGPVFRLSGRILPPPGTWRVRILRGASPGEAGEALIRENGKIALTGGAAAAGAAADWRIEFV